MPKLYLFATLLVVFGTSGALAQTNTGEPVEQLKAIERTVRAIDSLGPYPTKTLPDSWFLANGDSLPTGSQATTNLHQLVGHYNKKQELVKMVYTYAFSNGLSNETWYFSKQQLIFISVRIDTYPKPKKNAERPNFITAELKHKCCYFFDGHELLEYRNFGKGPLEHLGRNERRDLLLRRTGQFLQLLR